MLFTTLSQMPTNWLNPENPPPATRPAQPPWVLLFTSSQPIPKFNREPEPKCGKCWRSTTESSLTMLSLRWLIWIKSSTVCASTSFSIADMIQALAIFRNLAQILDGRSSHSRNEGRLCGCGNGTCHCERDSVVDSGLRDSPWWRLMDIRLTSLTCLSFSFPFRHLPERWTIRSWPLHIWSDNEAPQFRFHSIR